MVRQKGKTPNGEVPRAGNAEEQQHDGAHPEPAHARLESEGQEARAQETRSREPALPTARLRHLNASNQEPSSPARTCGASFVLFVARGEFHCVRFLFIEHFVTETQIYVL